MSPLDPADVPAPQTAPRLGTRVKALLTAVVLGLFGVLAGAGTYSAFSDTTDNSGNQFAAGTVTIGDNDADGKLFDMSGMKPGDFEESCIRVDYTGSLPSTVKLYGTTTGTGLDTHLNVTVTRGTKTGTGFDDCTDFTADSTDYVGLGAGVVFKDTLQAYPDTWTAGIVDAPGTGNAVSWTNGYARSYKIRVELPSTASSTAAGLNATQQFTWEAQNQ